MFEVLALGLDMLSPGQLTVEVKAEVPGVRFYRTGVLILLMNSDTLIFI